MERRKVVLLGVGTIAAFLVVIAIAPAVFCEASLHVTKRSSGPAPVSFYPEADWRTIRVKASDGTALDAWFVRPTMGQRGRCVLILHGIADSRLGAAGFAPLFLARGYDVLLPDSRGHGSSGGEIVTFGVREKYDVLTWVRWMRDQGCTRLYGLGESLGAAVLIQTAEVAPVFRAIVAEGAYTDLRTVAIYRVREHLNVPRWLSGVVAEAVVTGGLLYARVRYGVNLAEASPLNSIRNAKTPILLIHGMDDKETPPIHSRRLAAADSYAVLWLVPNAGHTGASAAAPREFQRRVLGWFAEH